MQRTCRYYYRYNGVHVQCHVRGIVGAQRGDVRAMYDVMTLYTDVAVTSYGGQKTKVLRAKGFLK